MGRPRRAGERASKVMFAKNQSVLRFIDILPSKVSLGYGARAKKRPDFVCVGGGGESVFVVASEVAQYLFVDLKCAIKVCFGRVCVFLETE